MKHGQGTYVHSDGSKYTGDWLNDLQSGNGSEEWSDGATYSGQYLAGRKNGKGKYTWPNGSYFEGQFVDNDIHGYGVYVWTDGCIYKGQWAKQQMDGEGIFEYPDGRKYEGNYVKSQKHGQGRLSWPDGRLYEGEFALGEMHGHGIMTETDGTKKATAMAATGGLAILVDEKRVNELLQQKSGIKALLRSAFNTILFVCFLLLFTSLALSEPRNKMRAFEGFLRKRFDEASPVRLEEVQSVDGFWRYFNESFKPAIYGEDTARYFFPGAVVPTWLQVLGPNYMYGMGRMRILNILPDSDCRVGEQYRSYFPTCYGPFNLDAVDREPFGPPNDEGVPTYQFSAEANGENYEGWLASYPPGGYMEMLTPDYPKTNDKFLAMKQNGFISEKTRAIFL
ncbi:unnamed protein product, partial [Cladocopium goreaui]